MNETFPFPSDAELEHFGMVFAGIVIGIYVLILIYALVNYIIFSKSLSTLAKRRGIRHPGLIWVPYARNWQTGNIVDEYDIRKDGRDRKWRAVLMWLAGIVHGGYIAMFVTGIVSGVTAGISGSEVPTAAAGIIMVVLMFAIVFASIGLGALQYVAYYKIFESCNSSKPIKYLLIAMLVPFAFPFVFRHCRNMDNELYAEQNIIPELTGGVEITEEVDT